MTEGMESTSTEEAIEKIAEGTADAGVTPKTRKSRKKATPTEKDEAKSPKKDVKKKPVAKKKRAKRKKAYNVDKHPETGAMQLQENYFYRLLVAEQKMQIKERDLQLAKANVKDFQAHANQQLQTLQSRVKEFSNELSGLRMAYMGEVGIVEKGTGLSLKEWTIDDDRVLRPIEEASPPK